MTPTPLPEGEKLTAANLITICAGKYTLVMDPTGLRALRYGEPWRDLIGDGFVMALGHEIQRLREELAARSEPVERVNGGLLEAAKAAFGEVVGRTLALAVERNGWDWPDDAPEHVSATAEKLRAAIAQAQAPQPENGELEAAEAALIRASDLASDMSEGWLEEARQANAEGAKGAEHDACKRASTYDRITNAMQPALGVALRRRKGLSAQPLPQAPVDPWRPIETLEDHCFPVLVGREPDKYLYGPVKAFRDVTGAWLVADSHQEDGEMARLGFEPTLWQPLPPPPSALPVQQPSEGER